MHPVSTAKVNHNFGQQIDVSSQKTKGSHLFEKIKSLFFRNKTNLDASTSATEKKINNKKLGEQKAADHVAMKNSTSHIRHSSAKFSKALPVPTDAAPTKEILIQSQKNEHTKNITNAIPFAKLGIKILPKDVNEKNRHLFTEMEAMKNEINMLTKMIASTAVIDKNQRPSEGHGSLIELKKELITVFRKAAEWSTGDDFYGDEITKAVSNLQATLENISPEAASKKHSYMKH